jgi:thioredoxin-related protein
MQLYFKGFIIKVFNYILLFTFFLSLNLFAGSQRLQKEMNYEVSYEKALEKALKQNKPIMMMIGQTECPYCNKFEVKTLIRKKINEKVQKDFIPLSVLYNTPRKTNNFLESFILFE